MANLGYLQLKGNPGVWNLQLKPNSRSTELYQLVKDNEIKENQTVIISDFSGAFVPLRVCIFLYEYHRPKRFQEKNLSSYWWRKRMTLSMTMTRGMFGINLLEFGAGKKLHRMKPYMYSHWLLDICTKDS